MEVWFDINKRRCLAKEFIKILDDYLKSKIIRERKNSDFNKYCIMIFALQDLTGEYIKGKNS